MTSSNVPNPPGSTMKPPWLKSAIRCLRCRDSSKQKIENDEVEKATVGKVEAIQDGFKDQP